MSDKRCLRAKSRLAPTKTGAGRLTGEQGGEDERRKTHSGKGEGFYVERGDEVRFAGRWPLAAGLFRERGEMVRNAGNARERRIERVPGGGRSRPDRGATRLSVTDGR